MKATAKDLRFKTKKLLETVRRGEEVVITFRGKPCAKLVSIVDGKSEENEDELFGIWKDHELSENVDAYVRSLRNGRFQ